MDIKYNCFLPSKVNGKCVYGGKWRSQCTIYKVKCSMCNAIYIGNTQQTFKKIMDGHFSDLLRLLRNGKKSDSFYAHFEQPFNTTTSRTDIRKYMTFKLVKQIKEDRWKNRWYPSKWYELIVVVFYSHKEYISMRWHTQTIYAKNKFLLVFDKIWIDQACI